MTIPKLRAAIVVFLVGFALGLSVFVASRLFVRAILSSDAIVAAEELASQLAEGKTAETSSGSQSAIVRYTYFDTTGKVVESGEPGKASAAAAALSPAVASGLADVAEAGGAIVEEAPPLASLFGLEESAIKKVVVPVKTDGRTLGALVVEVDQRRALESLGRAFSVIGIVTVGLAVLAVIAVAFAVTRGRGFGHQRAFDASRLPRDTLTDVPTRSGLTLCLQDAIERATTADRQVGLMIVGLDEFRAVNDIWGHAPGDEVLRVAAERLKAFAGRPGAVARVAGDEFAIVIEGEATHEMRPIADKLRSTLSEPFEIEGSTITLGASIGAALYPINAESAEVLFRAADSALSKAKAMGRGSLAFFDTEMKERMRRNAALERDLRQALSRDEFVIFYQPQLELASGRVRGYEALVRWERPGEGILAPRDFLAVAEETGLIRPIGEWVLRKACEDAATWLDSGTVAVNFSAAQFHARDIDKTIARILQETGLAAERLEIEVPESLFLDAAPEVMETLNRLKALGVRVAMDDFGGGYTGLASLAHFPFDKIKIDRSFVAQLTEDADVAAVVSAIVALGRTLSVDVTAEGVETSEQVTLLKAAGCSFVQGFMFGVPKRQASAEGAPAHAENAAARHSGAVGA